MIRERDSILKDGQKEGFWMKGEEEEEEEETPVLIQSRLFIWTSISIP